MEASKERAAFAMVNRKFEVIYHVVGDVNKGICDLQLGLGNESGIISLQSHPSESKQWARQIALGMLGDILMNCVTVEVLQVQEVCGSDQILHEMHFKSFAERDLFCLKLKSLCPKLHFIASEWSYMENIVRFDVYALNVAKDKVSVVINRDERSIVLRDTTYNICFVRLDTTDYANVVLNLAYNVKDEANVPIEGDQHSELDPAQLSPKDYPPVQVIIFPSVISKILFIEEVQLIQSLCPYDISSLLNVDGDDSKPKGKTLKKSYKLATHECLLIRGGSLKVFMASLDCQDIKNIPEMKILEDSIDFKHDVIVIGLQNTPNAQEWVEKISSFLRIRSAFYGDSKHKFARNLFRYISCLDTHLLVFLSNEMVLRARRLSFSKGYSGADGMIGITACFSLDAFGSFCFTVTNLAKVTATTVDSQNISFEGMVDRTRLSAGYNGEFYRMFDYAFVIGNISNHLHFEKANEATDSNQTHDLCGFVELVDPTDTPLNTPSATPHSALTLYRGRILMKSNFMCQIDHHSFKKCKGSDVGFQHPIGVIATVSRKVPVIKTNESSHLGYSVLRFEEMTLEPKLNVQSSGAGMQVRVSNPSKLINPLIAEGGVFKQTHSIKETFKGDEEKRKTKRRSFAQIQRKYWTWDAISLPNIYIRTTDHNFLRSQALILEFFDSGRGFFFGACEIFLDKVSAKKKNAVLVSKSGRAVGTLTFQLHILSFDGIPLLQRNDLLLLKIPKKVLQYVVSCENKGATKQKLKPMRILCKAPPLGEYAPITKLNAKKQCDILTTLPVCPACSHYVVETDLSIESCGSTWHRDHFKCASSGILLTDFYCDPKCGIPYSLSEYNKIHPLTKCPRCNESLLCDDGLVEFCSETLHKNCFVCSESGRGFSADIDGKLGFYVDNFKPYDPEIYVAKHGKPCFVCKDDIHPMRVCSIDIENNHSLFGHAECIKCKYCSKELSEEVYFDAENGIYCEDHFSESHQDLCAACKLPIFRSDKFVFEFNERYHESHFTCAKCSTPLADRQAIKFNDILLCVDCHIEVNPEICYDCTKPVAVGEKIICLPTTGRDVNIFHSTCTFCSFCRGKLNNDQSILHRDGLMYCKDDFYDLFFDRFCGTCNKAIKEEGKSKFGKLFHAGCNIQCFSCGRDLETKAEEIHPYKSNVSGDWPACKKCAGLPPNALTLSARTNLARSHTDLTPSILLKRATYEVNQKQAQDSKFNSEKEKRLVVLESIHSNRRALLQGWENQRETLSKQNEVPKPSRLTVPQSMHPVLSDSDEENESFSVRTPVVGRIEFSNATPYSSCEGDNSSLISRDRSSTSSTLQLPAAQVPIVSPALIIAPGMEEQMTYDAVTSDYSPRSSTTLSLGGILLPTDDELYPGDASELNMNYYKIVSEISYIEEKPVEAFSYSSMRGELQSTQGYLEKKGGGKSFFGRKNWKNRYFVIYDGILQYYTSQYSFKSDEKHLKTGIDLSTHRFIKSDELFSEGYVLMKLVSDDNNQPVLVLRAPLNDSVKKWFAAFEDTCDLSVSMLGYAIPRAPLLPPSPGRDSFGGGSNNDRDTETNDTDTAERNFSFTK